MTAIPTDVFTLDEPYELECCRCGKQTEVDVLVKTFENISAIHADKESGEDGWKPVQSGWECKGCQDES